MEAKGEREAMGVRLAAEWAPGRRAKGHGGALGRAESRRGGGAVARVLFVLVAADAVGVGEQNRAVEEERLVGDVVNVRHGWYECISAFAF